MLVTTGPQNRLTALIVGHGRMDADFPEIYRNDPNRRSGLSDHDPLVAYLSRRPADDGCRRKRRRRLHDHIWPTSSVIRNARRRAQLPSTRPRDGRVTATATGRSTGGAEC